MAQNDQLKYWVRHYEKWKASGQTQKGYCESLGLKLGQFKYWNHQWRAQQCKPQKPAQEIGAAEIPASFVPVQVSVKASAPGVDGSMIVLWHHQGWQVELPGRIEASWLGQLLRELS